MPLSERGSQVAVAGQIKIPDSLPGRKPTTFGDWKGRTTLSTWAWRRTGSSTALKPGLPAAVISASASGWRI